MWLASSVSPAPATLEEALAGGLLLSISSSTSQTTSNAPATTAPHQPLPFAQLLAAEEAKHLAHLAAVREAPSAPSPIGRSKDAGKHGDEFEPEADEEEDDDDDDDVEEEDSEGEEFDQERG
eukprot:jgi/Chlat1/7811/Chrsp66S07269